MAKWTKEDLYRLDAKYAEQGLHFHQRPFHAAQELLRAGFSIMAGPKNPDVDEIYRAYAQLIPDSNSNWPGSGFGFAISLDQARKFTLPVFFGDASIEPWQGLGFESERLWWLWCRGNLDIASESCFSLADAYDFSYGLNDIESEHSDAITLWKMAQSNLEDISNILPATFNLDAIIQPICMVAELTIKGALAWNGTDIKSFKGREGHNLTLLAGRMTTALPHRDDLNVRSIVSRLPPYVDSRYKPAGLTRLEVARLALAVQFIAGSALRRVSNTDLAAGMESGGWPAPRRPFFTNSP